VIQEAPSTPLPMGAPLALSPVSGRYVWSSTLSTPAVPQPVPLPTPVPLEQAIPGPRPEPLPIPQPAFETEAHLAGLREELRLDVDGRYPQMTASGTITKGLATQVHWIARLQPLSANSWNGTVWHKDDIGGGSFPYTSVRIEATRGITASQGTATVTFSGGSGPGITRTYQYQSPFFHEVEFEFDVEQNQVAALQIQTHAHPNRPPTLPNETLTIAQVYQRTGFDVRVSPGSGVINSPLGSTWSDLEMHDALQQFWSRFANMPQWALWVLFAALHEDGTNLGGVMFDDIGPNHRQGTAIFQDSFIKNAPAGDPAPDAWVQRMRFWTACHEMGHAFNLAHAWQKALGVPWMPLANEPEARSFMNYPFRVQGGSTAFFSNFEYRFSDQELLFLRHAPSRFVQMGNAAWFDHHGFQQANVSPEPTLQLEVLGNRVLGKRQELLYEFLEPVMLDFHLKNVSAEPQLVPEQILRMRDHMTIVIKKDGQEARQFLPHVQYCWQSRMRALNPGEVIQEGFLLSADRTGWLISEPGWYTIQVVLHRENEDIVSAPVRIRVEPPRDSYKEELLAQDLFSENVGRVLRFDGSRVLERSNDVLREVVEQLPDRCIALHAQLALGNAAAHPYKELVLPEDPRALVDQRVKQVEERPAKDDEARRYLSEVFTKRADVAQKTFGDFWYKRYQQQFSDLLKEAGRARGRK
jgi:hypothetical protein